MSNLEALHRRAKALNLHGLLAHWGEAAAAGWLATLIDWEEQERTRRSLERRLRAAHIGRFKPIRDIVPVACNRGIQRSDRGPFVGDFANAGLRHLSGNCDRRCVLDREPNGVRSRLSSTRLAI